MHSLFLVFFGFFVYVCSYFTDWIVGVSMLFIAVWVTVAWHLMSMVQVGDVVDVGSGFSYFWAKFKGAWFPPLWILPGGHVLETNELYPIIYPLIPAAWCALLAVSMWFIWDGFLPWLCTSRPTFCQDNSEQLAMVRMNQENARFFIALIFNEIYSTLRDRLDAQRRARDGALTSIGTLALRKGIAAACIGAMCPGAFLAGLTAA